MGKNPSDAWERYFFHKSFVETSSLLLSAVMEAILARVLAVIARPL